MLASMFVYGGVNALRNAPAMAPRVQPVSDALQPLAPGAPLDAASLVRANGLVHVVAGTALATGHFPRIAALVLAGTLGPTTIVGHPFWDETDPTARANQRIHFLKNVSMAGGLLMSTLDPDPHRKFIGTRVKDKIASLRT